MDVIYEDEIEKGRSASLATPAFCVSSCDRLCRRRRRRRLKSADATGAAALGAVPARRAVLAGVAGPCRTAGRGVQRFAKFVNPAAKEKEEAESESEPTHRTSNG